MRNPKTKREAKMQIAEPKSSEVSPAGAHVATLIKLVDLGWQTNSYQGTSSRQRQAMLTFELSDAIRAAGHSLYRKH